MVRDCCQHGSDEFVTGKDGRTAGQGNAKQGKDVKM